MKISYQWLSELVEFDAGPRELARALTMAGLAVDSVEEDSGDHLLDFDLTSNRPDALSHLGIAREIAAIYKSRLVPLPTEVTETGPETAREASVEIRDPDLCPRYVARLISEVRVGPSPRWLVERLEHLGQRSINNVADITNWVLWEMGQPLHAFDADLLEGRRIVVRRAEPGERIRTLDGIDRVLDESMLVIADASRPVALAGIMGGADTEISLRTRNVLLESAYFQPNSIRRTARRLGMATEASHRFERGADIELLSGAANRAARMICELAGGKVLKGSIDVYPTPLSRSAIRMTQAKLSRLMGFEIDSASSAGILRSLGFTVESSDAASLAAVPPSYRVDIEREEDLIEEVGRIAGYDRIPTTLPVWSGCGEFLQGTERKQALRGAITSRGFDEAITFSFVNEEADEIFAAEEDHVVRLQNPIDETRSVMRRSLMPGILESMAVNLRQGVKNVRLFEIGRCFRQRAETPLPTESEWLGIGATGVEEERNWRMHRDPYDFFHLKGLIQNLMEVARLPSLETRTSGARFLHPGRSLEWLHDGQWLARIGELHPAAAAAMKFKQPILVGEVRLDEILGLPEKAMCYTPLPRFPTVVRDLSFVVDRSLPYGEVERAILALELPEVREVRLFDLFTGGQLPPEMKSLSISLRLRSDSQTLHETEIELIVGRVVNLLKDRFKAELRK